MRNIPWFWICLIISVLLLLGAISRAMSINSFPVGPSIDTLEDRAYWQTEIGALGGAPAYEKLVASVTNLDPGDQHVAAHAFGGALYVALGLPGIHICDSRLSSGCFHEFVARAIRDLGLSSVKGLDDACFDSHLGASCQHGIGHGVLSYLGYDQKALTESLDLCRGLRKTPDLAGCAAGVFMEYNVRLMLGKEGPRMPPEDPSGSDWIHPCDALTSNSKVPVSESERKSCALFLPQWWWVISVFKVASSPSDRYASYKGLFGDMGERCRLFKSSDLIQACFEGMGQVAPLGAGYDPETSAKLCDASAKTQEQSFYCKTFAAVLFKNSGRKDSAYTACSTLSQNEREQCGKYIDGRLGSPGGDVIFPETN